jgi:hypothetical protein
VTVEVLGEHPLANFREDVKLAPTLGLPPGWLSWGTVAVGVVAAFLLAGLAGLAGMVALGLLRKSRRPFGPCWSSVRCRASLWAARSPAGSRPPRSAPGRPGQLLRTMMRPSIPV